MLALACLSRNISHGLCRSRHESVLVGQSRHVSLGVSVLVCQFKHVGLAVSV